VITLGARRVMLGARWVMVGRTGEVAQPFGMPVIKVSAA
jgi:hypothetical protein